MQVPHTLTYWSLANRVKQLFPKCATSRAPSNQRAVLVHAIEGAGGGSDNARTRASHGSLHKRHSRSVRLQIGRRVDAPKSFEPLECTEENVIQAVAEFREAGWFMFGCHPQQRSHSRACGWATGQMLHSDRLAGHMPNPTLLCTQCAKIGITGDIVVKDVDGPFVTVALTGLFWHRR
eukprot:9469903-Pyramimonas_sp.AAC.2